MPERMDALYHAADLIQRTLDDASIVAVLAIAALWQPVLTLIHEAAHGIAALRLSRGGVGIVVGRESWAVKFTVGSRCVVALAPFTGVGGHCAYDPDTLRRSRDEAWVAVAGPAASAACAVILGAAALFAGEGHPVVVLVLLIGAWGSAFGLLMTALPIRYALGSGVAGAESDGLVAWRILSGGPPGRGVPTYGRTDRARPAARPVFLTALAVAFVLAVAVQPVLGLWVLGLFAYAAWRQRRDERADAELH